MQTKKYIELTNNTKAISKKQTIALNEIVMAFPYFQSARVLYLKGLKKQNSFVYNDALKKTAAYTTNRTVLFDFITSDVLDFEAEYDKEESFIQEIEVIDSKLINHLKKSIKVSEEKKNLINNTSSKIAKTVEKLEIGKPLNFQKNDVFSFNEWLQLSDKKQIDRKKISKTIEKSNSKDVKKTKNTEKKGLNSLDLINKFLEKKPKIKPVKTQIKVDVASDSVAENANLMTETLARVYIEQKKYNKAIAAFKILSLKYPKKSSFFADQINTIKILQKS